jgi:poly(beta-D-mannuronate) lyase
MRHLFLPLLVIFSLGCKNAGIDTSYFVTTADELDEAIKNAEPGQEIVMANGVWEDIEIRLTNDGEEGKPIILRAETSGEVIIQGKSNLKLGGDYLTVEGLYFTNGYSPSSAVIAFAINDDNVANNCIVTNCVIIDFNKLQRNMTDLWILFQGRHNQLDHCYITGKSNRGPTVRVDLEGNQNIKNHHKIINNYFGPRPPKGGPSAETIQIGNSYTSMCPSYTLVANNLFERCNGEVEIISSKTNFNEFRNNVFYKSEGSLVTRHGNYCIVDGNYFIGDEESKNIGGIRLIGTGHRATNNYFYNLKGQNFRSPLAVMNGIPKSPLNRYIQVTDVVIAYNSWVNCKAPLQFGVGSNVDQKDVLPASEIRSDRPIRTVVANNLIYNEKADNTPIVAHDLLDGIRFESNVINNQGIDFENSELIKSHAFDLIKIAENLWIPSEKITDVEVYSGFEFNKISEDLFGTSREENNSIGATVSRPKVVPNIMDKSKYGPKWYKSENSNKEYNTHQANNVNDLVNAINKANDGDTIILEPGSYALTSSLKIDKTLSIISTSGDVTLAYNGAANTPLFSMNPKGKLTLTGLQLQGNYSQYAFSSLQENMSSLYNITVKDCIIENFNYVLKAYKYSFSEHLNFSNSTFTNCENGIELSEETEDKGEYNAENITIDGCRFTNIQKNVIDYYRGGYDESTVGGNLLVINSTFSNCGAKEKNGILINTYGIVNVEISKNTFQNNRVKLIAQLWGAKNNTHSNNKITNSGKILVEENLKLNLLY